MAAWLPCTPTSRRHARDLSESPEPKQIIASEQRKREAGGRGAALPLARQQCPRGHDATPAGNRTRPKQSLREGEAAMCADCEP